MRDPGGGIEIETTKGSVCYEMELWRSRLSIRGRILSRERETSISFNENHELRHHLPRLIQSEQDNDFILNGQCTILTTTTLSKLA